MSVYVDCLRPCGKTKQWPYNRYCHLVADTHDELMAFAERLGLKSAWFQEGSVSLPHFDLTAGMRAKAINRGAVEIDDQELVKRIHEARHARLGGEKL